MTDRLADPTRFFDQFSRFIETDELGSVAPRLNARYLALIHENRAVIEGAKVLDLACHDGRFSFAALQNGADRVVGIEFGANLVQKAQTNMAHYEVPADKYEFLTGDIFELIDQIAECDVVLCFGIFYHINSHLLLLTKIAELDPRMLIMDTNVSLLELPVIELRGYVEDQPPRPGDSVEGYPSKAAVDAMLSSLGWTHEYFDWEESGLLRREQMHDYKVGKRVSLVVNCNRQVFSPEERKRAVQMVLDKQQEDRRFQRHTVTQVATRLGIESQALQSWVRKAEREARGAR